MENRKVKQLSLRSFLLGLTLLSTLPLLSILVLVGWKSSSKTWDQYQTKSISNTFELFTRAIEAPLKVGSHNDVYQLCQSFFQQPSLQGLTVVSFIAGKSTTVCAFNKDQDNSSLRLTKTLYFTQEAPPQAPLATIECRFGLAQPKEPLYNSLSVMGAFLPLLLLGLWMLFRTFVQYFTRPLGQTLQLLLGDLQAVDAETPGQSKAPLFELSEVAQFRERARVMLSEVKAADALKATLQTANARFALAAQVSHDIRSPIAALEMAMSQSTALPENQRVLIRGAVVRIKDIANTLLHRNRDAVQSNASLNDDLAVAAPTNSDEPLNKILLSSALESLVTEKRLQFRAMPGIEISFQSGSSYGLFALVQPSQFKRVISNLINNAVEAIEESGKVTILLQELNNQIQVEILDDGRGISPEILSKIGRLGQTYGKPGGSGLGLSHARTSIESWGGQMDLRSTVGNGTRVSLTLPSAPAPSWFVQEIEIKKNSSIVVIDDDPNIHQVWIQRFAQFCTSDFGVKLISFSNETDAAAWIVSASDLDTTLFLVDYELLGSTQTGVGLIEAHRLMGKAILVTSHYEDPSIQQQCKKLAVRLIPKPLAPWVPIALRTGLKQADAILLDDDPLVHMVWKGTAEKNKRNLVTFFEPDDFFDSIVSYERSTPVYIDSNLGHGVKGEDLVSAVAGLGFKRIFLATGYEASQFTGISGLSAVVGKQPPQALTNGRVLSASIQGTTPQAAVVLD